MPEGRLRALLFLRIGRGARPHGGAEDAEISEPRRPRDDGAGRADPLGGGDRASCRYDFILRRQTPGTHAADPSVNLFRQGFAGALRHAGRHRERHLCADEHHRGELRQTAPRQAGAKAHCQLREAWLLCTAQPPHGRGFTGHGPRLGEGGRCGLCPRRRSCAAGPLRRGSVPA